MTAPVLLAFAPIIAPGWLPPTELSPNARGHWSVKATAARETRSVWRTLALNYWWGVGRGEQRENGPRRRLTITMRRPRLLDDDNAYAVVKAVVDGLVAGGAALTDAPRHLEIVVKQERGKAQTTAELEEIA